MIKITIVKLNQKILTIEATGHSGYAEAGSDIVCCAVSTITQNLANSIKTVLKINAKVVIDETIPHFSLTLPNNLSEAQMKDAQILMQSAVLGLKDAKDSFSKFISIKETRK